MNLAKSQEDYKMRFQEDYKMCTNANSERWKKKKR